MQVYTSPGSGAEGETAALGQRVDTEDKINRAAMDNTGSDAIVMFKEDSEAYSGRKPAEKLTPSGGAQTPELANLATFQPQWSDGQNNPYGLNILRQR